MTFQELCAQLETKIINSYEQGVTLEEAERLAGEFLGAQLRVSAELKNKDLDSRTRKSGLKAVKATVYMACNKAETKLTEAGKAAVIDTDEDVIGLQDALDLAEVDKAELERYYDIFLNAHIFYRGVSKGRFE
jgi:hypothetical protein